MNTEIKLDAFTVAFLEAALWSSNDNSNESGGAPLDENYGFSDFAPETLAGLVADCKRFQEENAELLKACEGRVRWGGQQYTIAQQAGHDFWLTRCQHGAGFWDGDWPEEEGEALSDASHAFGNVDLYVGDDGQIWADGYERGPKTPAPLTAPVPA